MRNLIVGLKGNLVNAERIIFEPKIPVYEVFLAAPPEISGNGRTGLPGTNLDLVYTISALAKKRNIRINVLINSVVLNPNDLLGKFIDETCERGIDSYTIANYSVMKYLIEKRRRDKTPFSIILSTFMYITTPADVRKYQELLSPQDRIIINQNSNRNLNLLSEMVAETKIPLELFANTLCLQNCPDNVSNHAIFMANYSNKGEIRDPFFENCMQRRITDPMLILSSPIIRPEDLELYEQMGFFFYKLGTRTFTTDQTLNIIKAYQSGSFQGDISELNGTINLGIAKKYPIPNPDLQGMIKRIFEGSGTPETIYEEYLSKIRSLRWKL